MVALRTLPVASIDITTSAADMPKVWTERVRIRRPTGPGTGSSPFLRRRGEATTAVTPHPEASIRYSPGRLVPSGPMAKSKRRKRNARRKKANHGRKPNAGRG